MVKRNRHHTLFLLAMVAAGLVYVWISTRPALRRQGMAWEKWLTTPEADKTDRRLKAILSNAFTQWREREVDSRSFGVLRPGPAGSKAAHLVCHPFESRHASRLALDLWVGDINHDERADLLDLCLFAESLEDLRGGCGVFVRDDAKGGSVRWIHVDASGKSDRWGQWLTKAGDAQPVLWSKQQRSARARCLAWGLRLSRRELKLVVRKRPFAWVFDPEEQSVALHPCLSLYVDNRLVKSFSASLGGNPVDDKEKRDDGRTPEGEFYVCQKNPHSQYYRSLRLSYPNIEDASRGLRGGLIDAPTHEAILWAIGHGAIPPQDTRLGSDIMIHGGGGTGGNWTAGCIALDDDDVEELFAIVPPGTRVTVLPGLR